MEIHENDPTSEEPTDPWTEFHDEFGGIGERLKNTYRKVVSEDGPSEEEIKDAFGTLVGAWSQVAESVTSALQDPEVRERLKSAAGSFATAVGATLSELGSEMRESEKSSSPRPDGSEEE